MSTFITQAKAWKFAIFWFVLFSVNALCTSVMAALTGADWATLDPQSKFMICVAILGNWTGTIMAFMSKAAKKIESGQLPFDDGTTFTPLTPPPNVPVKIKGLPNS